MELKKIYNEYKYGRIITQIKFLIFERELESMMKEDCKISGVYILYDLFYIWQIFSDVFIKIIKKWNKKWAPK